MKRKVRVVDLKQSEDAVRRWKQGNLYKITNLRQTGKTFLHLKQEESLNAQNTSKILNRLPPTAKADIQEAETDSDNI